MFLLILGIAEPDPPSSMAKCASVHSLHTVGHQIMLGPLPNARKGDAASPEMGGKLIPHLID
jgi:hypothetical protein